MAHALELSTTTPNRATIKIDGVAYPLATPADVSLSDQVRIARTGERYSALASGEFESLSEELIETLSTDVRQAARSLLLEAPDDVFAKLTDTQCLQIVQAFGQEAPKQAASKSSRTSKSSRASSGSTAATRTTGQG